jgi:hypothetical protein
MHGFSRSIFWRGGMKSVIHGAIGALLCAAAVSASAAPVTYTSLTGDASAFTAATASAGISLTVDSYEDLSAGVVDYGQNLSRTGYSISAASLYNNSIALRSTDVYPISGYRSMILYQGTDPLTFTFGAPINAFGITFADVDVNVVGTFVVSINGGTAQTLLSSGAGNDLVYFFGIIDQAATFSSIAFDRIGVADGYYFDLVRLGSPAVVPIPAAAPLFLSGLAGIGFLARRRKQLAA